MLYKRLVLSYPKKGLSVELSVPNSIDQTAEPMSVWLWLVRIGGNFRRMWDVPFDEKLKADLSD